jgi:hypothetical protein
MKTESFLDNNIIIITTLSMPVTYINNETMIKIFVMIDSIITMTTDLHDVLYAVVKWVEF